MPTIAPEQVGFSSARLGKIRPVMQRYVDHGVVPGTITLIARDGNIVYCDCVGSMDKEAGKPMRPDAIFRIYSMTKPITAVAAMTLFEDGLFQLNDPITPYLPAFKAAKVFVRNSDGTTGLADSQRDITFHDLLTHTSGLSYAMWQDTPVDDLYRQSGLMRDPGRLQGTLRGFADKLATLPLAFQPGAAWRYSVANDVLGCLVSIIADMPFGRFLEERIFKPLAMVDSGFVVPPSKVDRLAALYLLANGRPLLKVDAPARSLWSDPEAPHSGGGGLVSTVGDYLRFAQMLLNGGALGGVRILSRKTVELMTKNHLPASLLPYGVNPAAPSLGQGYGLGVGVIMDQAEAETPVSDGAYYWNGAAKTTWWNDPKERLVGLMMTQVHDQNSGPELAMLQPTVKSMVYQAIDD